MTAPKFIAVPCLGSGALGGLGTLLAACGQQANNVAAATATAAPSGNGFGFCGGI